ncbi:MAG: 50S ribosomal protein L25 [bacterium]|nr:50S ribosomal protein L25 [bacterium]
MQQVTLYAQKRNKTGKGISRQLRLHQAIPGIVYGAQQEPIPIQVGLKDIHRILSSSAGENVLINLEIDHSDEAIKQPVIIKELQKDPLTREYIHVDFYRISLDKELTTQVPIVPVGIPIGVQEGGILECIVREAEVRCLPTLIPDKIEVDVTALKIGHTIHISDLKVPEGVTLTDPPDAVVMTIVAPKAVTEEAPVTQEVIEPELITKKPTEEELLDQAEGKAEETKEKPESKAKEEKK